MVDFSNAAVYRRYTRRGYVTVVWRPSQLSYEVNLFENYHTRGIPFLRLKRPSMRLLFRELILESIRVLVDMKIGRSMLLDKLYRTSGSFEGGSFKFNHKRFVSFEARSQMVYVSPTRV